MATVLAEVEANLTWHFLLLYFDKDVSIGCSMFHEVQSRQLCYDTEIIINTTDVNKAVQ